MEAKFVSLFENTGLLETQRHLVRYKFDVGSC